MTDKCTKCSLHKKCKTVGMSGTQVRNASPEVMIIQDAPSYTDDKWGFVLAGDGGEKLNWFLEQAGIDYKDVYFTSAIKCRPDKTSDIKKKHREECKDYLLGEILDVMPKIIICMGKHAHEMITENKSIREFRGHFNTYELRYEDRRGGKQVFKCKVMPTMSLSTSMVEWKYNDDIVADFKKAKNYIDTGIIDKTEEPKVNVILTLEALNEFVERYKNVKLASTDFETTGLNFFENLPYCAGYSDRIGHSDVLYILPYKNTHSVKWGHADRLRAREINIFVRKYQKEIIKAMKTVHGYDVNWVLHNGKFDGKFAKRLKVPYKNFYFDTMNADSLIDENLGHSLNPCLERRNINFGAYDTLLWKYTNKDEKNKKSYQHVPPYLNERYLGMDTDGCLRLYHEEVIELKEEGLLDHFLDVKMQTVRDVMEIEYIGFNADEPLIREAGEKITAKMDEAQKALEDFTGIDKFNVNSPKQMNEFMINEGYPLERAGLKKNKVGYSTAGDELEKLLAFKKGKCNLFPPLVLDFKTMSKLKGTYIDGKYMAVSERGEEVDADLGGMLKHIDKRGRIHTSYNLHSPVTGRESSRGPSVQVWPRPIDGLINCRNFVIPKNENWCLWEADYSALEINIVAGLSKDKVLVGLLQDGTDLHCFNAISIGSQLNTIPSWVNYDHMMVMNGKGGGIKDADEKQVKLILEEAEIRGKEANINWHESRTNAKALGFGLNYGKEAMSFAEEFGIEVGVAEDMIAGYFSTYKDVKSWRDDIVWQALNNGFVQLSSGRKRRFYGATEWLNSERGQNCKWSSTRTMQEVSRMAMNFPVQGGAHEVFEPANIRLLKRFRKEGLQSRVMFRIHDGILGECPLEEREIVNKCLLEEMPTILNKGQVSELTLKIDTDYYDYEWYGKKLKNLFD